MDTGSTDARLREAFRQMAPAVDATSFYEDLEAKLIPAGEERWSLTAGAVERAGGQERGSAPRRRSGLRIAVFASLAIVLVAAVAIGSLEAVKHLGNDQPALVITDDTVGISPGSTGQTGQTTPPVSTSEVAIATTQATTTTAGSRLGELVWKFQTGGRVFSSPAVSGGVVYVGAGSIQPNVGGYLYAVDTKTGLENWKFETSGEIDSSPAVSDGVVYVGSNDGYLYAVDAQSGTEKWKFRTEGYVSSSPAIADGVVYVGSGGSYLHDGGYLYAVDAQTGREKWKFRTGGYVVSSPAIAGGVVYVGSDAELGGYLYAVDVQTGTEKWKLQHGGGAASPPYRMGWSMSALATISTRWTPRPAR